MDRRIRCDELNPGGVPAESRYGTVVRKGASLQRHQCKGLAMDGTVWIKQSPDAAYSRLD